MTTSPLSYPRPTNALEASGFQNRLRHLGLPPAADALCPANTKRVVGGMAAIDKAAINGCLTLDALATLSVIQRPWFYAGLTTIEAPSVAPGDTARIEALSRRVKALCKSIEEGSRRLHWDQGGRGLTAMTRNLSKQAKEILGALEGRTGKKSSTGSIDVGLASPAAVTLLAASLSELAVQTSPLLQQISVWRDRHAADWFSGRLEQTAQDATGIFQSILGLCHHLTASSPADELVRGMVPADVGEHDILRLVQAYEYVKCKRPEIELSKISQVLSRLLTELEPFGSELAKTRFILAQWGHLLPRESLQNPTPYALLASALEVVACATSTGSLERDPFDELFGPKPSGALPAPGAIGLPSSSPDLKALEAPPG